MQLDSECLAGESVHFYNDKFVDHKSVRGGQGLCEEGREGCGDQSFSG